MPERRRKLLIADDSPTVRKVISLTFEDEGIEVITAGDGVEALRLIEAEPPPDIILADAVMPGPDGYRLCARVKSDARLRHVPVVLLIGSFEPFNEAEARRVGADTVLTKPFQSIRDLVSKVGSLIGGEAKDAETAEQAETADTHDRQRAAHADTWTTETGPQSESPAASRDETSADALASAPARSHGGEQGSMPAASEETHGQSPEDYRPDPAASFADLGADDKMIEARPAESFGSRFAEQTDARSAEHSASADSAEHSASGAAFDAHDFDPAEAHGSSVFDHKDAPAAGPPSFVDMPETVITEREEMSTFATHAASASTADDALLDLESFDPPQPAVSHASEADDFILDLADEPSASSSSHEDASPESLGAWREPSSSDVVDRFSVTHTDSGAAHAGVDAAAAFAEAAHGETASQADPLDFDVFRPAERAQAETRPDESHDAAIVREVVAEDVPPQVEGYETDASSQSFESETSDAQAGSPALRGFVEPTVVPAAEPVPAGIAAEFTEGSVEGDLPKAPVIAEARAGFEERAPAGNLSERDIEAIARRVVELMADRVVREIAWEVVPELAELHVKRKLEEERGR